MNSVLHSRFRAVWRRQIALHLLRGLCHVLAWALPLVLVALAADYWIDLPPIARIVLLAGIAVWLARVAYRTCLRHLGRYDALATALQLEAEFQPMDALLVSYVELDANRPPAGISGQLIAAAHQEAERRSRSLSFGQAVRFSALRRGALAAVAAAAVAGAFGLSRPAMLGVFMQRMLNPASSAWYPTSTTIERFTGDETVKWNVPLELFAEAGGRSVPKAAVLRVRLDGAGWERIELKREGDGLFRNTFRRPGKSFDYEFLIGDARPARGRISVVRPPQIVQRHVVLEPPAYTGSRPGPVDTLNLKLPEGTKVTWDLRLDRPVRGVDLVMEEQSARAMELAEDATTVRTTLPATASSSYRFRFHWTLNGRDEVDEEQVNHYLRVIPDQPPAVELVFPAEDEKAKLGKQLLVTFTARDDYGLAGAWMVYSLNDLGEERRPLCDLGGKRSLELTESWSLQEAIPDLKSGDIVTFAVEVGDGCTSRQGPQRARSRSRRVQFVTDEQYAAYFLEQYRKSLGQVRPMYLKERDSLRHLAELLRQQHWATPAGAAPLNGASNGPDDRKEGGPQ